MKRPTIEPAVNFDWESVDPSILDTHAESVALAAHALKLVLEWLWRAQTSGQPALARRLIAMLLVLRSTDTGFKTYTQAAAYLGCSRAAVSKDAIRFCDRFHAHLAQKSDSAREHMRESRLKAARNLHSSSSEAASHRTIPTQHKPVSTRCRPS